MAVNFESNFFTQVELLDAAGRIEVEGVCAKVAFSPDEIVYKQGDPSDSVYIVSSGQVEAFTQSPDGRQTRSLGYMGKGEFFGDLGILTGHERLAGIRTCAPTKLLRIEKLAFVRLLEKVPKMGAFFARNLARRLHYTSTEAHVNIYSVDLAGNLKHFDLLTIFQAIISIGRSGELHLNNAGNELIGSFFFQAGQLEHAHFGHLTGGEAVWQSFVQITSDGTFVFRVSEESAAQLTDESRVEIPSDELVSYGVACRDAYTVLSEPLRLMKGKLNRLGETLSWSDEGTQALVDKIWELIAKRPQTLDSMWRRLNVSSLTFLQTVNLLVETGQAELLADEQPVAEKPAFGESPAPG